MLYNLRDKTTVLNTILLSLSSPIPSNNRFLDMIINIKIKFIYTIGVYLAQDKVQWRTLTNIINNWTPQKAGNLSGWAITRFLRMTFSHEVSPPVIYTSSDKHKAL
jgi:hypothetical protein